MARAYVDAGSDVILTNTFRANAVALAAVAEGGPPLDEVNRAGVQISRRAAGDRAVGVGRHGLGAREVRELGPNGRP